MSSKPETSAAALENPYLAARREWNERYGDYIAQARNWRLAAILALFVAIISAGGLVHLSSQSQIVPYIVRVDKLGAAAAVERADQNFQPDKQVIVAFLARFIANIRSVYTDAGAERTLLKEAYAMINERGEAFAKLNFYMREHDPFKRAETETVTVEVASVLPLSEGSWRIEWREEASEAATAPNRRHRIGRRPSPSSQPAHERSHHPAQPARHLHQQLQLVATSLTGILTGNFCHACNHDFYPLASCLPRPPPPKRLTGSAKDPIPGRPAAQNPAVRRPASPADRPRGQGRHASARNGRQTARGPDAATKAPPSSCSARRCPPSSARRSMSAIWRLQEGEAVNDLNVGDSVRWKITPATQGAGDSLITHVMIKPTDVGLITNLVITTNRRTYIVKLLSRERDWMPRVAFDYPGDPALQWRLYRTSLADKQLLANAKAQAPKPDAVRFRLCNLGRQPALAPPSRL